jgi:hypothetical protein
MSLALLRQQLAQVVDGTKPGDPGLPTGLTTLDAALSGGGLPRGRLTELVGPAGSGKTTIVRQMVERTVADGWWVAYIDAGRTLAPRDWTHVSERASEGFWMVRPPAPARGAWCADVLLRSGAFALVILDGAPVLSRDVAVRLTRLARDSNAALVALHDSTKASELGGSLRLQVKRKSQHILVTVEKGGPFQTVSIGEATRGIAVARRVRTHPEIPDRRGVARTQHTEPAAPVITTGSATGTATGNARVVSARTNARSRRAGEPRHFPESEPLGRHSARAR